MTHTYQLIEANIPMEARTQDKEKREKKRLLVSERCLYLLFFAFLLFVGHK